MSAVPAARRNLAPLLTPEVVLVRPAVGGVAYVGRSVAVALRSRGHTVAELELGRLMAAVDHTFVFHDVPRHPPVRRDLAFVVPESVPAGELQGILIPAFVFVKGTQIPPGVRGRTQVTDGLSDPRCFIQHVGSTQQESTVRVREVRAQGAVGQADGDQAVGDIVRRF